MRFKVLVVLALSLLAFGCALTMHPGQVPPVGLDVVGNLPGELSVDLVNAQPDTTNVPFSGRSGSRFNANLNEWTQFYISELGNQLSRRGVYVSPSSLNKIQVRLSDFQYYQGFATVRVNMKVHLSSPDGSWARTFEETDTSGFSMGRAFGSVIYHSIINLLQDGDVMNHMRARSS
jgi:hypothetical protein